MADWRDRARCREADPELFFPVGTGDPAKAQIAEAKKVCAQCPVVEPCLRWALDNSQTGVWGGTSDEERQAIRRRERAAERQRQAS